MNPRDPEASSLRLSETSLSASLWVVPCMADSHGGPVLPALCVLPANDQAADSGRTQHGGQLVTRSAGLRTSEFRAGI